MPEEKLTEQNCRTRNFMFFSLTVLLGSTGTVAGRIRATVFPVKKRRMKPRTYPKNGKKSKQCRNNAYEKSSG